jgi:hypothetical protein
MQMVTTLLSRTRNLLIAAVAIFVVSSSQGLGLDLEDLERRASWQPPSLEAIEQQIDRWIAESGLGEAEQQAAWATWKDATSVDSRLERVALVLAAAHDKASAVIAVCRSPGSPSFVGGGSDASRSLPDFSWLSDEEEHPFVRQNLRLLYARWLAQHALYDEAKQQIVGLTIDDVVDPASLLFYRGVVHHRLLDKEVSLTAISQLLENEAVIPRRYLAVARLMEADLKPLKQDSLDEVARLMEDIQRRLQFGRAGKRVRDQEDEVIAKLDKMIKKIEEQQKQQQQQQSGSSQGSQRSTSPADNSRALGGKGPGDVDQKSIGNRSGWGNLPPKDRETALQQISKDLPAHFRDVIEEYFRKLASDDGG